MFGVVSPERATPRYWERAGKESNVGEFVSIGAPLSQHDTATRSGDCLRVWRLDGVAFESAELNLVKDRHDAWCNVLRVRIQPLAHRKPGGAHWGCEAGSEIPVVS